MSGVIDGSLRGQFLAGGGRVRWAAGCQSIDQWSAHVWMPGAAILKQEGHDIAQVGEIGPVDDGAAVSFGPDKSRPCENAEMARHRVVRDREFPGNVTSGQAHRFMPDQ